VHEHRPFDVDAADWIRAIADDRLDAVLARGRQAVRHRVDVGVDARADVLQIDEQQIDAAQHVGGRFPRLAVERVDRHAAPLVLCVAGLDHVFLDVRSEPVLRSEDRAERHAGLHAHAIGDVPHLAVHRRGIADDAYPAPVQAVCSQHSFGSKFDAHGRDYRGTALATDEGG